MAQEKKQSQRPVPSDLFSASYLNGLPKGSEAEKSNGIPNITAASSHGRQGLDPNFTQNGINNTTEPRAKSRTRKVTANLIQHIHDFARENDLTIDEWIAGVEMINQAGKLSESPRSKDRLLCDVISQASLVDEIDYNPASTTPSASSGSAALHHF